VISEAIVPTKAVRRKILTTLGAFAFLSYMLRMNISVAQQYMVPELKLTDIQAGQVFSAFMLGYAIFQVPAGWLGDRFGPRRVLAAAAFIWGLTTLFTGLVPGRWITGTSAALLSLLIFRFFLGIGEAAMYPVAARAVAIWMPVREQAFSNALVMVGSCVGSAFTPPLIASVMQNMGWRATFYLTSLFPFIVALVWLWQSRNLPEGQGQHTTTTDHSSWWRLLKNRNVLILSLSYFLDSYVLFIFVFWLFKYLVEVRKFSVIGGGWATSAPFVVASVALPYFGYLSDRLCGRLGILQSRRLVAMGCLTCSALLLFAGAGASNAGLALAAISLSVGFLFSTEGQYWATIIGLGGRNAGAASGLMNMAGNLGGVVSTAAMPLLVHYLGWTGALASGSALALVGAALWLAIRETPVDS
jgi:ACS family glucarate transporter-like MFS transporter